MDLVLFSFVSNLTLSESFFAFFLLDDFFLLTDLSVVGACVFAGFFVGATVGSTVGSGVGVASGPLLTQRMTVST